MKTFAMFAGVAALGLSIAACDSKAENQVEKQADAIDEAYEADANVEEAFTEDTPEEAAGEAKADQLRETGENTAKDLKTAADQMDNGTPN